MVTVNEHDASPSEIDELTPAILICVQICNEKVGGCKIRTCSLPACIGERYVTTPMPPDFQHHAVSENDRELSDRYDLSIKVVRRLRLTVLVPSPVRRNHMLPSDFNQNAHLQNIALAQLYGVGEKVIRRWRREQNILDTKSSMG
jgi:hypothetical protein